jgi:hypothetical protein
MLAWFFVPSFHSITGSSFWLPAVGPRTASLTMLISGTLGFICINLFYIDTFYMLAVQLWFIATLLAWISSTTSTSKAMREED